MKVLHVAGARPNFMKVAPVMRALKTNKKIDQILVHTGQHYDMNMSDVFFRDLGLPKPDINLEVGSGTHAWQTAEIMKRLETFMTDIRPDITLVYGDVNSTVAAALVCAKSLIPLGHVEAGLRSFDRTMPEEVNRLLTDQIANMLFTHSSDADRNLLHEGIKKESIYLVGNVMIDTLIRLLPKAKARWNNASWREKWIGKNYGLVTLHRPSNVDESAMLDSLLKALGDISRELPLIFPMHPRTRKKLEGLQNASKYQQLHLIDPMSYLDFLALQCNAALVITDSGGIQEETTYLKIPCLTLRENTERPITVTMGTNIIIGQDMEKLKSETRKILGGDKKKGKTPPLWDGHAAERIAEIITKSGDF